LLARDSSPTSRAVRGSSTSLPIEVRNDATMPPIACSRSGYRSRLVLVQEHRSQAVLPGRMLGAGRHLRETVAAAALELPPDVATDLDALDGVGSTDRRSRSTA
jgi:hypothetical protein